MLKYSSEAKRLVATLKQYRNDIDIFTEDEIKDREFYKILFQRLLGDTQIEINDITPLGCRKDVINRCESEPDNGRKKIFIIDGDIYIIYKSHTQHLKNLFVLDSYCIENYIIDNESCCRFAYNLLGTEPIEEIERKLQFEDWIENLAEPIIDLFLHFSILHELSGKFTLYNANKFIVKGKIDFSLVEKEINLVKSEILEKTDEETYNELIKKREERWPKTPENFMKIVSGKDYILPLVQIKIQEIRKLKGLFTNEAFKAFLAQFCKLDRLEPLKQAMLNMN